MKKGLRLTEKTYLKKIGFNWVLSDCSSQLGFAKVFLILIFYFIRTGLAIN